MPLPKIATPTYELVLPSSDRKIKYRPFLVKEEKVLIIALESQDQKQIANAVKAMIEKLPERRGMPGPPSLLPIHAVKRVIRNGAISCEKNEPARKGCIELG